MRCNLFIRLIFIISMQHITSAITPDIRNSLKFSTKKAQSHLDDYVTKVSLTQKGYIQFLKYDVDVPELRDYTFCLWIKSNNLTYSHPLLSYSIHEDRRLIRVWISPYGTDINLEILDVAVFKVAYQFTENKWYHVCQSWSSRNGAWALIIDKHFKINGFASKLMDVPIKGGGDIVVGQEYTDFDKGLDDGIEGDISGFNMVQASIFGLSPSKGTSPFDSKRQSVYKWNNLVKNNFLPIPRKPLGLNLVELSYRCGYLRGAPLTGNQVIVSWTKTTVRVFGGAILTNVRPFCVP